ncbi:MAG: hypothetical protein JWN48_4966, partial [Myxococcaceae bacterium]|nr:hypothetical protein [Myxococcaceae bacterium]
MARRVGSSWVTACVSVGSLALLGLTGCYEHHTADEELLDIPFPDEAYPADAGIKVGDAGASKCTGTDPIALFFCNLTQPPATGAGATGATQPGIGDLLGLLGGGGTAAGGGTGAAAPSIADLIALLCG